MATKDLIYGTDLVYRNRFVAGANRDYLTVNGIQNLRNSIMRRLMTSPGSFKVRPEYGCGVPDQIKKPMTSTSLSQLKKSIISNLLRDPRISNVSVTLEVSNFGMLPGLTVIVKPTVSGQIISMQPFSFSQEQ